MDDILGAFVEHHMKDGQRPVPARLQTALALLERLRESPHLDLEEHLVARGRAGLKSHETFGKQAHDRLDLAPISRTHGRRSSNLQEWGQELLNCLRRSGFERQSEQERSKTIDAAQQVFARQLRTILEDDPLEVHIRGRSAEAAVREVMEQASSKGKAGEVAQYLVGAKLTLRFGEDVPALAANRADRRSRSDSSPRPGDFVIGNAVIEVALGYPDEKHLTQVANALQDADFEVWLITRESRVAAWRGELERNEDVDFRRVVVASIEGFVGQNISELGQFSSQGRTTKLQELFEIYNTKWIDPLGGPGLRIVAR